MQRCGRWKVSAWMCEKDNFDAAACKFAVIFYLLKVSIKNGESFGNLLSWLRYCRRTVGGIFKGF